MASIRKDIHLDRPAADTWEALRDFGAVHRRLAPGFVTDCRLDGADRLVTFVTGVTARERLVAADDERWRLVYTVVESPLGSSHHQASVEVVADGDGSRLIWITDVLPDDHAAVIERMMDMGAAAMASYAAAP